MLAKTTFPAAAKDYRCSDCGRRIAAGERHEKTIHKSDITNDRLMQARTCQRCAERYGRWLRVMPEAGR